MKNQFAKIAAVLMVLAMAVSVFGICAFAAEETTVLLGDVNLDGKVTIQDATLIQKAIAKLATLDEVQTVVADATEDGNVNVKDATAIQKWIAKFEDANQNIGQPIGATGDEATPEEATPEEATPEESTPEESTPEEATKDEPATEDQPVVDEPTYFYTVAGEAGLCGVAWDPAQNVMTDDGDGTWSITFTGIAAGTYQFKVVQDGAWGNPDFNLEGNAAGGGANATVTVDVDNSTVVIGFDGEKAVIEAVISPEAPATEDEATTDEATTDEATADEATADEVVMEYYLVGYINSNDVDDTTYAFVDGVITVDFTADSYIAVKDSNGVTYWTNGWLGFDVTSTVLAADYANTDKLFVPTGLVTITWDAATSTVSYTVA